MVFCHRIIGDAETDVMLVLIYFRVRFQCVKTPGENALQDAFERDNKLFRDAYKTRLGQRPVSRSGLTRPVVQIFAFPVKMVTVSTTKTNKNLDGC